MNKLRNVWFAAGEHTGGVLTIPPGEYELDGSPPLPLRSHTTVLAYGARFRLPGRLGDGARFVGFAGTDVQGLTWCGGEFHGHVFDPARSSNAWEPNANSRVFALTTTADGLTRDLLFRDVRAADIGGAVIHVEGATTPGVEYGVDGFAERVAVESCTLLRSGKFMWDYGHLWQQLLWPGDWEPWEVDRARRYFLTELLHDGVRCEDGDDRVRLDNRDGALSPGEGVCLGGAGELPANLVRGRRYFVVDAQPEFVRLSDTPGGVPCRCAGGSRGELLLIANPQRSFYELYAPAGCGPGKGGVDLVGCRDVRVTGCQLSALGDTMHIQRSHNVVFAGNQILGSRMGAFFLAEFCRNATVTGNTVDGTNGSRVMSVEKSCTDVTIVGNTFRGGGRGSWINQPRNLILADNVFVDNTTKGEADPRRGRRSFVTGEYERYPELYFTTYEPGGRYGPVIVRDNVFVPGESCASELLTCAAGGRTIRIAGNVCEGAPRTIRVEPGCERVEVRDNVGAG